jgi:hypothetical protein
MKPHMFATPLLAVIAATLMTVLPAVPAEAADSEWQFGINGGFMYTWNEDAVRDFSFRDAAFNLGGSAAWRHPDLPEWMALEGEATATVSRGEWRNEEFDVRTAAAYAVGRWGDEAYFMLRGGVLWERVKVDNVAETDIGRSLGGGIGYHAGGHRIEVQFTSIERRINYLSLTWWF